MRHTKIVATLGPASSTPAAIGELIAAGVDVFRLNFSHGTREGHAALIARVRHAAREADRVVGILQDLSGPKIRIGSLTDGASMRLTAGETIRIAAGDFIGTPGRVSTAYAELPRAVRPGDTLLLDEGRIQLKVDATDGHELRATVLDGGLLAEHAGINAPGVPLPPVGLSTKDAEDLRFGVEQGVDLIALSFVQNAGDLLAARTELARTGAPAIPLIAKLERPEAVAALDEILAEADAVMVARGDLGLEMPLEQVPRIQKEVTRRARARAVPVIVATQVLESMRSEPRPTRAEVSDAANAVDDGVDAIMLAGETAVGAYAVRAVETLDAVIRDAETIAIPPDSLGGSNLPAGHELAIAQAAVTLAERSAASAIVAVTSGGATARLLAALRPHADVYAATDDATVGRRLSLVWGVSPVVTDLAGDVSQVAARIGAALVARGAIPPSSTIVLASLSQDPSRDAANFLKLQRV